MKKTLYICIPLIGAVLAGCESDANLPVGDTKTTSLTIKAPMFAANNSGNQDMPEQTELYQFDNGLFVRSETVSPDGQSIEINTKGHTKVFCVAGVSINDITSTTTLENFLQRTVTSPAGANSAPLFYAGAADINKNEPTATIEMCHGVARIDVACQDQRIVIKEIIVENAPAESFIIPADAPLGKVTTVNYSRKIDEDFDGTLEQAFTIFESAQPVTIHVKGTFDGDLMNFSTTIPVVNRNKIYTLGVSGGSDLDASITIADWAQGDKSEGLLALGETKINMEASSIPADVKIDASNNNITFPATGVKDMKLAFVTKTPLKLANILGSDENVSITADDTQATANGYISTFSINIAAQPKCGTAYNFTVMFNGGNNFFINMEVEASPYQIPTVHIGGHDWMCFNAVSNDVEDQIYILDGGLTIEEMYNNNFVDCVGNYFQYGKPTPLNPWTSYDPAQLAEVTMDRPWSSLGKVPLPKGFHIPTLAEWADLIPNKTTIPASYMTASGDSIKATLVTLPGTLVTPSAAVNAKNFKMRYVLFESVTSGAKLYLPLAGLKAAANVEIPGYKNYLFDTHAAYWTRADRDIMFISYKTLEGGVEGAYLEQGRWGYDGLVSVRGIKD